MRKPPTGEPCAGEPHARFGGRGRREPFPTPIGRAMFAKLFRLILICLFISLVMHSSTSAQETDRATLIERAKKEGEVVWYTSAGLQDSKPMADVFQKDYPFIQVSIIRAGSGVLINKILNEARAQKGLFDVLNTNDESVLPAQKKRLDRSLCVTGGDFLR